MLLSPGAAVAVVVAAAGHGGVVAIRGPLAALPARERGECESSVNEYELAFEERLGRCGERCVVHASVAGEMAFAANDAATRQPFDTLTSTRVFFFKIDLTKQCTPSATTTSFAGQPVFPLLLLPHGQSSTLSHYSECADGLARHDPPLP